MTCNKIAFALVLILGLLWLSREEPSAEKTVDEAVLSSSDSTQERSTLDLTEASAEQNKSNDPYFESMQDQYISALEEHPLQIEYAQGDAREFTEEEVHHYEEQRLSEHRLDMIKDLNDGVQPNLTQEDKEVVSQLFKEEGLESVYD